MNQFRVVHIIKNLIRTVQEKNLPTQKLTYPQNHFKKKNNNFLI